MRRRIKNKLNTKKRRRAAVVALAACALALVGGAYAYFTSTGSGTDQATVGSPSAFDVTFDPATAGTMLSGVGYTDLNFTVTNPSGAGQQRLASVSVQVASDGNGDVTTHSTPVPGCKQAWFSATVSSLSDTLPKTLDPNGTVTGTVRVTMPADPATNQDPCQGAQPDIVVNAS